MIYSVLNIGKGRARIQTAETGNFQFNGKFWYSGYSESEQTISKFPTKQKIKKNKIKNMLSKMLKHILFGLSSFVYFTLIFIFCIFVLPVSYTSSHAT